MEYDFRVLLNEREKILFNLFYRITEEEHARIFSDGKYYFAASSKAGYPLWIWLAQSSSDEVYKRLGQLVLQLRKENENMRIQGEKESILPVLKWIEKETGIHYRMRMNMNVYSCYETAGLPMQGRLIRMQEEHMHIVADYIRQMEKEIEETPMSLEDAQKFAQEEAGAGRLFLWEDEGNCVAMGRYAHMTEEDGRIHAVYTSSQYRGRGYARMLTESLSKKILEDGRIPMLYADAANAFSNKAYKKAGFQLQGEIAEFWTEG